MKHYATMWMPLRTCSYQMGGQWSRVALFTERSFEMIAAMLATVKVGASYIPIDIDFPNKRQGAILEDAKVTAVMSYGVELKRHYQSFNWKMLKALLNQRKMNNMMIYMAINLKTQRC